MKSPTTKRLRVNRRPVILSGARSAKPKDPDAARLTNIARSLLPPTLLLLLLLFAANAHAQGCAQCLDTTRATTPATQAAYRHAIELLAGVASALFLAGLILLRRNP